MAGKAPPMVALKALLSHRSAPVRFSELPDGHKQLRSRARLSRSYDSRSP